METINIPRYVDIGKSSLNWYRDCQLCFEELFGKEKLQLVCQLFAATSINTSLKSNITLFRKAYWEIENQQPVGNYLPNIQNQLRQIRSGKQLTGRKIRSFAAAMSGDVNAFNVEPRQLSSMIWAGVRIETNGDREVHYTNILKSALQNLFGVI